MNYNLSKVTGNGYFVGWVLILLIGFTLHSSIAGMVVWFVIVTGAITIYRWIKKTT